MAKKLFLKSNMGTLPSSGQAAALRANSRSISPPPKSKKRKSSSLWHHMWQARWLYVLLLPGALYFLLFYYLPLLGNISAFQNYSPYLGFFRSAWVGTANFVQIFTDPNIWTVTLNTLVISLLQILFAFPVSIILALMLNELSGTRFKRLMQSIYYLPHFIGWVVIISIWQEIFGGDSFVSHLFTSATGHTINLLANPDLFKPMLVLQVIWKDSGWGTVVFMAAIAGVNMSLHEAAAIDGAGRWRRIWHVTLPGIRSVITLLLILRLGNILNIGFEQVFLQMQGQTLAVSGIIDTYVYQLGVLGGQWGYAAAVGLLKVVTGGILIFASNAIAKKFGEGGLF
jgi:putative aldouronate transport system permease protein